MTRPAQNPNSQRLGYILVGIAILLTLSLIGGDGAGWLWIGAIAAGFLYFYRERRQPALAVPGGILAGISAGVLLETMIGIEGIFLVGFAGGFYLITLLEPKKHAWAIYPAVVFLAISTLIFLTDMPWVFILGILALGIYFLNRHQHQSVSRHSVQTTTESFEVEITHSSEPESRTSSVPHSSNPPMTAPQTPVSSSNFHTSLSRLDRLKAWRSNIAAQNQIPPQDVLSDAQLEHLAHAPVNTLEGLQDTLEIQQLVKYGQAVLAILH